MRARVRQVVLCGVWSWTAYQATDISRILSNRRLNHSPIAFPDDCDVPVQTTCELDRTGLVNMNSNKPYLSRKLVTSEILFRVFEILVAVVVVIQSNGLVCFRVQESDVQIMSFFNGEVRKQ